MTRPITHIFRLLKWGRTLAKHGALRGIESDPNTPRPVKRLARVGVGHDHGPTIWAWPDFAVHRVLQVSDVRIRFAMAGYCLGCVDWRGCSSGWRSGIRASRDRVASSRSNATRTASEL